MITKTFGGERIGTGAGFSTKLKGFERSTFDLGAVFRSTAAIGTIIPCYVNFCKQGDVWNGDITSHILTHPTIGPIFGSFKYQIDIFTADVRLYNADLHNNIAGLGMRMSDVKFPTMRLNGKKHRCK